MTLRAMSVTKAFGIQIRQIWRIQYIRMVMTLLLTNPSWRNKTFFVQFGVESILPKRHNIVNTSNTFECVELQ